MASSAIQSQGTVISCSTTYDSSATGYTAIKNVQSISGIGSGSASDIDVTDLQSTAKEYLTGLKDEGEISIALKYDYSDAGQGIIQTAVDNSSLIYFDIEIPISGMTTGARFSFSGTPKSFSKDIGVDAVVDSTITVMISGSVTETDPVA